MTKSNKKDSGVDTKSLIKHSTAGAAIGMLATMMAILVFAALILTGTLPEKLRDTFVLVSVILGATLGGLYCAGRQGGGVVTAGLSSAAVYVLLALMGTLLFGRNSDETVLTLRIIIAASAGGCFGGVLKLHRKKKKSRLRR